jgi:Transcriptional regulators
MASLQEECAHELMDVVPLVTRFLRKEMRRNRAENLSIPQFRALYFLRRNPGTPLIDLAEHLGLTPPSTSKLIDILLNRGLLVRESCPDDRRRIAMHLTAKGGQSLDQVDQATLKRVIAQIDALSPAQIETITQAMQIIRNTFKETEISPTRMP